MSSYRVQLFDGRKAVDINSLPPEAWVSLSGDWGKSDIDRLYGIVAWLYRCVSIRGYSVTSMPFEIRRGEDVVYQFNGSTAEDAPPKDLPWIDDLPYLLGRVEVSSVLGGRAYLQRENAVMGNTLSFKWLVPWSVTPNFNNQTGELESFRRTFETAARPPVTLAIEDVVYFWLPDYAVELGPAINYPGRAVLQNAGVVASLDLFLKGYFDRGMIKATLLQYKDPLSPEEKPRVKEWWRRVFTGVANAFATEVVRGDFEVKTIGDGIKDLRDSKLSQEEKDSIAVGLGVPPSKLLPVGVNRATKDGDDRGYIEDTILPEIGWIYRIVNQQILQPLGYSIVAKPQELRVMQTDEVERSEAFRNYVGNGVSAGYTVLEAENILGIHVPNDIREEVQQQALVALQQQASSPAVPPVQPEPTRSIVEFDHLLLLDKRDERDQFLRWLKNRDYTAVKVDEFKTTVLTHDEKLKIATTAAQRNRKALAADKLVDNYGDELARYVRANISKAANDFSDGFRGVVESGLLSVFKQAVGIDDSEDLTIPEQSQFDELMQFQLRAIDGYVETIYANKGAVFDTVRDGLQGLGANLGGRLQMWKNSARQFWNRGLVIGRRDNDMTWRIGATEESCVDCLFYNGQTKTKAEWLNLAGILIYPQSRALACNGYNCDCTLVLA